MTRAVRSFYPRKFAWFVALLVCFVVSSVESLRAGTDDDGPSARVLAKDTAPETLRRAALETNPGAAIVVLIDSRGNETFYRIVANDGRERALDVGEEFRPPDGSVLVDKERDFVVYRYNPKCRLIKVSGSWVLISSSGDPSQCK